MEGLAEVSVVQEYMNVESKAIEVIYYFPIEESAVVTNVEAVVEGRRVVGKVKEKQEAREEYRSAVAQGRTAMKVEEVKADILELKVGRLAAGAGYRRGMRLRNSASKRKTVQIPTRKLSKAWFCIKTPKAVFVR